MNKKLTNSESKKLRKDLKINNTSEGILINKILSMISREVGKELKNVQTIDELQDAISKLSFKKLNQLIKVFGREILKKNKKGYEKIITAMVSTISNGALRKKQERVFSNAVHRLGKEERLYKPLLDIFTNNMSKIKNLPQEAFDKLQKAYFRGEGFRASTLEKDLTNMLGKRAKTIIRTESSKLNSALTEVRSRSIDVKGYRWSSSEDNRVRSSHGIMNGLFVFWTDPPKIDGEYYHAGNIYNCRCVPIPIIRIDDIQFPVRVAEHLVITSKYDKQKKKTVSQITGGRIATYTRAQFIDKFKHIFLESSK